MSGLLKLLIDAIRWLFGNLLHVGVLVCVLYGLHLVVNVLLPQWQLDHDRLSSEVGRLQAQRDRVMAVLPDLRRQAARALATLASRQKALTAAEREQARADAALNSARAGLASSAMARYKRSRQRVADERARERWRLLGLVLLVIAAPLLWRTAWYFVLMPLASRWPPLQLADKTRAGEACLGASRHSLETSICAGEALAVRADWLVAVGDEQGTARRRTRLFWHWRAPFLSYAARLFWPLSRPQWLCRARTHDPAHHQSSSVHGRDIIPAPRRRQRSAAPGRRSRW